MATLNFTGTDRKTFTPVSTALSNLRNGQAGTIIVLIHKTVTGSTDFCGLVNNGASAFYHSLLQGSGTALADDDGVTMVQPGSTITDDTTNWYWFAVDWSATLGSTENFHWRDHTGGGSWTHAVSTGNNGGTAASPGTSGHFRIGSLGDFATGSKDTAIVAVWAGTRFANSDYGSWTKTSDLYNHALGAPSLLVECNASTLVDLIGGSTYSSANSSGTTLTGADPPSFTFDGVGGGAASAIVWDGPLSPAHPAYRRGARDKLWLALDTSAPITVSGGVANDDDSVPAGTAINPATIAGGVATEDDSVPAGTVSNPFTVSGGVAAEDDSVPAGTAVTAILVSGGVATEDDSVPAGTPQLLLSVVALGTKVIIYRPGRTARLRALAKRHVLIRPGFQPYGAPQTISGGVATEDDSVPAGTVIAPIVVNGGVATEDDSVPGGTASLPPLAVQFGTVINIYRTRRAALIRALRKRHILIRSGFVAPAAGPQTISGGIATEDDLVPAGTPTLPAAASAASARIIIFRPRRSGLLRVIFRPHISISPVTVVIAGSQTVLGGWATENDSVPNGSVAMGGPQTISGGVATEDDSVPTGAVSNPFTVAGGVATENDSVPSGAPITPGVVAGGVATEDDSVPAGQALQRILVTGSVATEDDSVPAGTVAQAQLIAGGVATESDSIPAGNASNPATIIGGVATESDSALVGSVINPAIIVGGVAAEVDLVPAGNPGQGSLVFAGVATEVDSVPAGKQLTRTNFFQNNTGYLTIQGPGYIRSQGKGFLSRPKTGRLT